MPMAAAPVDTGVRSDVISPHFPALFRLHIVRDIFRRPILALLSIAGIAVGVAVFVTIEVANYSAIASFQAGIELVAGKAKLEVRSARGELDETLLPLITSNNAVRAATPLVEGSVTTPGPSQATLQILGVDIFTNIEFSTIDLSSNAAGESIDPRWMGRPGQAIVSRQTADLLRLTKGDELQVEAVGHPATLHVAGITSFDEGSATAAASRLAIMDIGWAQELLGKQGRLSRILVDPAPGMTVDSAQRALSAVLPGDVIVERPQQRTAQLDRMLSGFQLNLAAMSRVSLLVGLFLVYNTITASVVRRRREIGILRSLGASRTEVRLLYLGEALLYGIAGTIAGLVMGIALGNSLLRAVEQTISSLYIRTHIDHLHVPIAQMCVAAASGIFSAIAGAWFPANEAARVDPIEALHAGFLREKSTRYVPVFALLAIPLAALTPLFSWVSIATGPAWLGFAAAFCVMAAFALVIPLLAVLFAKLLDQLLTRIPRSVVPRLGIQSFGRSLHRTAVTVAALQCAVALGVGVAVMIHSFRETVRAWIDQVVVADVFATNTFDSDDGRRLAPGMISEISGRAEVAFTDTYRQMTIEVRGEPIVVAGVDDFGRRNLVILSGNRKWIADNWTRPKTLLASESAANRLGLKAGEPVVLPVISGTQAFVVAGIYRDFTSDRGVLLMNRSNYRSLSNNDEAQSVAIYMKNPSDSAKFAADFRSRLPEISVLSNRDLRARIFEIFDQTFAVTHILRIAAVAVAIAGITLALASVTLERARELATLRCVGASTNQVCGIVICEAATIGLLASASGIVSGLCLSLILTWVINRAFFGWTIDFAIPVGQLAWTIVWVTAVAVAAALWPVILARKIHLAEALREE
jgi:putative ABC transport system permease protein